MDKRFSSIDDIMNSDLFDQIVAPSRKQKQVSMILKLKTLWKL